VEKRRSTRFPISLPARLLFAGKRVTGCTVNISSRGALIVTDDQESIRTGTRIEGVIDWPVGDGEAPVELRVWGNVAWFRERLIGVETRRHVLRAAKPRRGPASEGTPTVRKNQSA